MPGANKKPSRCKQTGKKRTRQHTQQLYYQWRRQIYVLLLLFASAEARDGKSAKSARSR